MKKTIEEWLKDKQTKNKEECIQIENNIATTWLDFKESIKPINLFWQLSYSILEKGKSSSENKSSMFNALVVNMISLAINKIIRMKGSLSTISKIFQ
jgi:hypothetical protein